MPEKASYRDSFAKFIVKKEKVSSISSGKNVFSYTGKYHKILPGFRLVLLRSEIPSGMCAKLRTVAASNNRDHPTRSLYYSLFAPRIYIFVLRAHPVRGESHNQRNATGEVATL